MIQKLQKLQKQQMRIMLLPAALRERSAEDSQISSNSSDSEVKFSSVDSQNTKAEFYLARLAADKRRQNWQIGFVPSLPTDEMLLLMLLRIQ